MKHSLANHAFLLVCGIEEAKAVLKSPPIADFSPEFLRRKCSGKIKFQLHRFMHRQFAGHRCSQSALADVFGAPVERGPGLDDQALVHQISWRYSRC